MTHAFCFFYNVRRWVRWGTSLALAPKKSVALQAMRGLSPDVAPVLGESGAGIIASSADQAPPAAVLVPSAGQAVDEATDAISLSTSERAELSATLVVSTTADMV